MQEQLSSIPQNADPVEPLTYATLLELQPDMHPDLRTHVERLAAIEQSGVQPLLSQPIVESQEPGLGLEASLTAATEKAHQRSEVALEHSEFMRTPELERAVDGYYADHYRLAAVLEGVIDKQVTADDVEAIGNKPIADNFVINKTVEDFLADSLRPDSDRVDTLKKVLTITESMLFQEVCVGATTIGDDEVEVIRHLFQKLQDTALAERVAGVHEDGRAYWKEKVKTQFQFDRKFPDEYSIDRTVSRLKSVVNDVWQDSRLAGQLLFHNTAFMDDIVMDAPDGVHFTLRSRSDRLATDGTFKSVTTEGTPGMAMHTNVTHWSEDFMSADYKQQNRTQNTAVISPATIALPMAEMVKVAPYGRDCEYGVLEVKNAVSLDQVPYNDGVIIGAHGFGGTDDVMGPSGNDRTFFSDKLDHIKGHNYRINLGDIMNPDGHSLAHVIQLQSDYMRFGAHEIPNYGSGYHYPQIHSLPYDSPRGTAIYSNVRPGKRMFEDITPQGRAQLGLGPYAEYGGKVANEHGSFRHDMTPEQQDTELTQQVKEIMIDSKNLHQYEKKVIVPLRQGVMAYISEGNNEKRAFGGLGELIRNRNTANIMYQQALQPA